MKDEFVKVLETKTEGSGIRGRTSVKRSTEGVSVGKRELEWEGEASNVQRGSAQ